MEKIIRLIAGLIFLALVTSCEGFLDPKPDQSMLIPTSVNDVRSLLDNTVVFARQPVMNILAGDDFMASDAGFASMTQFEQQIYSWSKDAYPSNALNEWAIEYNKVFYANVALETLKSIDPRTPEYGKLKGEALFQRSYAYYHLLQQFAPAYQKEGGNEKLAGIVLKDSPDINEPAVRSSLADSYARMISDLEEAVTLLPDNQLPKTRPTKAVAYGLLGRIYLNTFDFSKAAEVAEKALGLYGSRMDFNGINVNAPNPFTRFGEETVFYSETISMGFQFSREVFLDTLLLKTYEEADLRLPAYFDMIAKNKYFFTGKLTGNTISFGGLSVGELELTAAEAHARNGNDVKALHWLNALLSRRIKTKEFVPIESSGAELLERILLERRKELVGRGLRWSDLRRLNQEPEHRSVLKRKVNGIELKLEPNSEIYVFLIPELEIQLSGISQNR